MMSTAERDNWIKIKAALERSGNVDSMFYKRACAVASGQPDPMPFKSDF